MLDMLVSLTLQMLHLLLTNLSSKKTQLNTRAIQKSISLENKKIKKCLESRQETGPKAEKGATGLDRITREQTERWN